MLLKDSINTALNGLHSNRTRSALTILGIVIGIASIILIASTGNMAEGVIVGELGGLGAETIVIRPGKEPSGPSDIAETLFADSIKQREVDALLKKSNVPNIIDASPAVFAVGSASYRGETYKPFIFGYSAESLINMLNLEIERGVVFDKRDTQSKAQVVVIGSKVEEELFGEENAIGKSIQIKGRKFRVIGVFAPRGQVVFFNVDELAIIPHTTAQAYLTGTKHFNEVIATAESPELVNRAVFDIEQTLRELHNITDPEKDDFYVQTQQGLVDQIQSIIGVLTLFLSLVVAISLVVGGVGIMNIMLVSVSERTKEIGLRKAVGATSKDIRTQFLLEAAILTGTGGIIGVILGILFSVVASFAIARFLSVGFIFSFPFIASLLGIGSSVLVGVVFGLYPAITASKKSPIEALRYE
jgi:putative ABC transport system permease protein